MTTKGIFTWRDKGSEIGTFHVHFDDIDAGGLNYDDVVQAINNVKDDIEAITLCTDAGFGYADSIGADEETVPVSNFAQREVGLRVFCVDSVNSKRFHFTIPGPDLASLVILAGTDMVDLEDASIMADLVTTLEAQTQSPDGNGMSVRRAVIVGRRN